MNPASGCGVYAVLMNYFAVLHGYFCLISCILHRMLLELQDEMMFDEDLLLFFLFYVFIFLENGNRAILSLMNWFMIEHGVSI